MGSLLSRSVEIRIFNRTQSITLRNPRTYFECGSCYKQPLPQLRPGSSDTSHFPGSSPFWGVAGILVYEAESFTLAIYFSNPIDYNKFSMELGLELSLRKIHWTDLPSTYTRMAKGAYSSSFVDAKFARVTVKESKGVAQLNDGPIRVSAIMTNSVSSIIEVMLEDQWRAERGSQY
ncbi:hypothetical protein TURU_021384 [Turdus rufiventris]|nr:hypothetical protein TURU_021384 [Turdus rufiventris]